MKTFEWLWKNEKGFGKVKVEFGNIKASHIVADRVFYLYGNYKKTFFLFSDFVREKLIENGHPHNMINVSFCSISECAKIINSQCDLFGTKVNVFCIRNIEDNHLDKLTVLFRDRNNIFVLESGDYGKSKKITETFTKNSNIYAVASFKSDITLISLCKMMLPNISPSVYREIIGTINDTDEDLGSFFKKTSLLLDGGSENLLSDYVTYKKSFMDDIEFIPLVRYLLRLTIKEKLGGKSQSFLNMNLSKKNLIESLLKAEIEQKSGLNFPKSYIYNLCS